MSQVKVPFAFSVAQGLLLILCPLQTIAQNNEVWALATVDSATSVPAVLVSQVLE